MNKTKRFFNNVYFFLISGKARKQIKKQDLLLHSLTKELLLLKYAEKAKDDGDLQLALDYIERTDDLCMIPYNMKGNQIKVFSYIDDSTGMPYIIHKGKKLFFPSSWPQQRVEYVYADYIYKESLTGCGLKERLPHQYQSEQFIVNKGDVLVDVGCAEALFALDVIERVSKAYLIENDKQWFKALEKTFAPWNSKVTILHQTLSDHDSKDSITLESIITNDNEKTFFVKMDIEGGELTALQSAEHFLKETTKKLKIAACVYHRVNDAEMIESLLKECGFSISYSSGYILTNFMDNTLLPTLRKGVIRAEKN